MPKKKAEKVEKPQEEDIKNVPIAEILIASALKLGEERNITLGELVGHMEVAKIEVYSRVTGGARAAAEQASSADKESA